MASPLVVIIAGALALAAKAYFAGKEHEDEAESTSPHRIEGKKKSLATTIQELRAEMLRELEQARDADGRLNAGEAAAHKTLPVPAPKRLSQASQRKAATTKAVVVAPARPREQLVDYEQQTEALLQSRRAAAERHNDELDPTTHRAFHQQVEIGKEGPPPPRRSMIDRRRAREGFVWREILSPPLALRDREEL